MPDDTANLGLPLLAENQAQKYVTINEALSMLDALVQLAVKAADLSAPPVSPAEGDRYIVAAGPTGAWTGHAGDVALYTFGQWVFLEPKDGWIAFNDDSGALLFFDGGDWEPLSAAVAAMITELQNLQLLGIGTTADANNPLSARLNSALFTALYDADAGTGNLRFTMNKEAAADTLSFLFQTNFSGRAEFGLTGDDDFHLKVSANGSAWFTAFDVARASGDISNLSVLDSSFTIKDDADPTKAFRFQASGIGAATTRTLTVPNLDGTLMLTNATQTVSGTLTFTGGATFSAAALTFGSNTGASTYNYGSGATLAATTKTLNIGTGGVSTSITNINLGSAVAGALGTLTINSPTVAAPNTNASFGQLGVGGATADATNKLAFYGTNMLFNSGGSIDMTFNKNAAANDASMSFKTGFSTRAIVGLLGDDDLHFKVSPNGSSFYDGLVISRASGKGKFNFGLEVDGTLFLTAQAADPGAPTDGQVWYNSTSGRLKARVGGSTSILGVNEVPFLVPEAGRYIRANTTPDTTTSTVAGVANRMSAYPFIPKFDFTCDRIGINVTALLAASNAKVAIYDSDALGRPNQRLTETGDLDCSTTGAKEANVTLDFKEGKQYWIVVRTSGTQTLSAFQAYASPNLDATAIATTQFKTLNKTLTYATAAPANWTYVATDATTILAAVVWFRIA